MKLKFASKLSKTLKWHLFGRTYSLVEMESYARSQGFNLKTLAPRRLVKGPDPRFWGGDNIVDTSLYDGSQYAPEISLIEFSDAIAVGRTEFVIKDGKVLYPQVIDPEMDVFMIEIERRAKVDSKRKKIRTRFRSKAIRVEAAISLLGQCSGNYAHWVTETLSRFALVEGLPELRNLPVLVDDIAHEKALDALGLLNVSGRQVIHVHAFQKVHARKLFHLTVPSHTPPETRRFFETGQIAKPRMEQFMFSDAAITALRELAGPIAVEYVAPATRPEGPQDALYPPSPKRVFLTRQRETTGNGRLLTNAVAIEKDLVARGFSSVDMINLCFEEQVAVLQDAEIVVSPMGAACVNLAFCKPGVQVVLLSPCYPDANYFYWANLMTALGHHALFVLGPQTLSSRGNIYHRDFRVRPRLLDDAIAFANQVLKDRRSALG